MPIKKLTFSFDVPLTSLLSLIAAGQADMRIDVLGDDKPTSAKALAAAGIAGLLEAPSKRGRVTNRGRDAQGNVVKGADILLAVLAKNPDHTKSMADLKDALQEVGLSRGSVSPLTTSFKKHGWVSVIDRGIWKLTPEGLAECTRRNIEPYQKPVEAKPPKPDKPKKQSAAVKSSSNGAAHHG